MREFSIEIIITDQNGEVIARKTATDSFETAEENLGKLERWYKNKTAREIDLARGKYINE